jgi:DnaK suppressor protein
MTPDRLAFFTGKLQMQRSSLLAQLRQQRGAELTRADAAAQAREVLQGDCASDDAQLDLALALQEREMAELNDIEQALLRLADDTYGECVDCGTDIAEKRLEAFPTALRCVACQTGTEKAMGGLATPSM